MHQVTSWIEEFVGIEPYYQIKILNTVIAIFIIWLLRRLILGFVSRQVKTDLRQNYIWRNTISYVFMAIGILVVFRIWFAGLGSLATYFGLLSAGIAIALQTPLVNLAGWFFMMLRAPFKIGDRIQIGAHSGDVIDIRLFQFTINEIGNWVEGDQSTGRIISIPNGKIFSEEIANYNRGLNYIWNEMQVLVTFESDWEKAKKILNQLLNTHSDDLEAKARKNLREASKDLLIMYTRLTPIVYTSVKDSGILLSMRFLVDPRNRRGKEEEIWEEMLRAFEKETDIDFAYPTTRLYDNRSEGKPGKTP